MSADPLYKRLKSLHCRKLLLLFKFDISSKVSERFVSISQTLKKPSICKMPMLKAKNSVQNPHHIAEMLFIRSILSPP